MFLDPEYGSVVFVTVEGESKYLHDIGTRAIEDPNVQGLSRPQETVAEDELILFELKIANNGWGESTYAFYFLRLGTVVLVLLLISRRIGS